MGNITIYVSLSLLLVSGLVYLVLYLLGRVQRRTLLELVVYLFFACVNIGSGVELLFTVLAPPHSPEGRLLRSYWFGLSTGGLAMLAVGTMVLADLLGIDAWLARRHSRS